MNFVSSPFDMAALVRQNQAEAKAIEDNENARRESTHKLAVETWARNVEVRKALGLPALPMPEAPLKFHATFDTFNFVLLAVDGPDRLPQHIVAPMAPPPAPAPGQLGELWPGRDDVRFPLPNDATAVGTVVNFQGAAWVLVGNPFGGKYWLRQ